jgi:hypothetical protein
MKRRGYGLETRATSGKKHERAKQERATAPLRTLCIGGGQPLEHGIVLHVERFELRALRFRCRRQDRVSQSYRVGLVIVSLVESPEFGKAN